MKIPCIAFELTLALLLVDGCAGNAPAPVQESDSSRPGPKAVRSGSTTASKSVATTIDWQAHFGQQEACFAMLSMPEETWVMSDEARCRRAFRPFSTFKIANALIGLETGSVAGADTVIEWDSTVYPASDWWPAKWRERNDLRSAFRRSALPYFRALATRIGEPAMKRHLRAIDYGNADTSGKADLFWITGGLRISAVEQIQFLRSLREGQLSVSERAQEIVKDIMVRTRRDSFVIRAKTGTGMNEPGHALGWFVGYVERGERVHYFALNRSGHEFADIPRQRTIAMAEAILAQLGAIPARPEATATGSNGSGSTDSGSSAALRP